MKHKLLLSILLLFTISVLTKAQTTVPVLNWEGTFGGYNNIEPIAITTDDTGNVYVAGVFKGSPDFNPHPVGQLFMTSAGDDDIFIVKLNPQGGFLWAKRLGGTMNNNVSAIAVDDSGNVYTTGSFRGTSDFDPGSGVLNVVSAGWWDIFVHKLSPSGNLVWVKTIGGTASEGGSDIKITSTGDLIITGAFTSTVDFDPGVGTYTLYSGSYDAFVLKLSSQGAFIWVKSYGGINNDFGLDIDLDQMDNMYIMGEFKDSVDFDPGAGVFIMFGPSFSGTYVTINYYLLKLDSAGSFQYAKQWDNPSLSIDDLVVDDTGSVYFVGSFFDSLDCDPSATSYYINGNLLADIFVGKLDSAGNFAWAKPFGSTDQDFGYGIDLDNSGNVYFTGKFKNTIDCDGGTATYPITSNGNFDIIVEKMDNNGNFIWAKGVGATGHDGGTAIAIDTADNILIAGIFRNVVNIGLDSGIHNMYSVGLTDGFITRWKPCTSTYSSLSATVCTSYTSPSGNYTWYTSGTYSDTLFNAAGCDSIITITLTSNSTYDTLYPALCYSYISPSGNDTLTSSGVYQDTLVNSVGCDSILTINLTIFNATTQTISPLSCGSYTSPSGLIWNASGTYNDTIANANGCDSVITINLTVSNHSTGSETVSVCDSYASPSGNYVWSSSGTYQDTILNTGGCDSAITVYLTVEQSYLFTTNQSACDSYTWAVNGSTYTSSTTDTVTYTSSTGCDSVYTLDVTVNNSFTQTDTVFECASYTWAISGATYDVSGTYTAGYTSPNGCDSNYTLELTIGNTTNSLTESVCETYTAPDNQVYTTSGQYTATVTNSVGCDSIIEINLTVTHIITAITSTGFTISAVESGNVAYQWLDCNKGHDLIIGETNQSYTPTISGDYAVEITKGNCVDTSNCKNITGVGITDLQRIGVKLYPNPTDDELHIDKGQNTVIEITITDNTGKQVYYNTSKNQITTINMSELSSGIYLVKVVSDKGVVIEKVVKK